MKKIDCLGEMCPIPMIKLQKETQQIENGETVMLVTDHNCTLTNVNEYCKVHQFSFMSDEPIAGVWEITISNK